LIARLRLPSRLLLAALAAIALATGATACGDSGDGDAAETSATAPARDGGGDGKETAGGSDAGSAGGPALSGGTAQAKSGAAAVEDVYAGFGDAIEDGVAAADVPASNTLDAAAGNESLTKVCDLMSEQAKRQTVEYAKRSAGLADVEWTCEKATGLLLRRAGQAGGLKRSLRAEVVGVNVDGERATASVRFGKGATTSIPLVKEDGRWKLGTSPSGGGG
jgi:hypothetical protein